ncbi:MAG TPA: contractile injection system protein, VgrG/Pvc8 family, partial [Alphaproteobacteria bacterium]|nr:contractile injection system protein, VgrG/Pvc8 family [Alphaproteobacteria bacterium]
MAETIEFAFICGNFAKDEFSVLSFNGHEAISQLYRFEIDLVSEDMDIALDDLHDQPSTLTITAGSRERRIQGVVAEVDVLDQAADYTIYRVV